MAFRRYNNGQKEWMVDLSGSVQHHSKFCLYLLSLLDAAPTVELDVSTMGRSLSSSYHGNQQPTRNFVHARVQRSLHVVPLV